jgi:hypothetical protein
MDYKMSPIIENAATRQDGLWLQCTLAGRVIYQSVGLHAALEDDLTGRNLNDFIADSLAAAVVSHAGQQLPFSFESLLGSRLYRWDSARQGDYIALTLTLLGPGGFAETHLGAARFVSGEIRRQLQLMSCGLSSGHADAYTRQGIFRLTRLAHNLEDWALCMAGALPMDYRVVDMTALCRDLSGDVADIMAAARVQFTARLPEAALLCRGPRARPAMLTLSISQYNPTRAEKQHPGGGRKERYAPG